MSKSFRALTVQFETGDIIKYDYDTGLPDSYVDGVDYEPSIVTNNGYLMWHKQGKLHRLNGPAVFGPTNRVEYWIDGVQFSKEDWNNITNHDDHYP